MCSLRKKICGLQSIDTLLSCKRFHAANSAAGIGSAGDKAIVFTQSTYDRDQLKYCVILSERQRVEGSDSPDV